MLLLESLHGSHYAAFLLSLISCVTVLSKQLYWYQGVLFVQPLLKAQLPVYLWWIGDPPDNDTVFNDLVELSNRVIVDSTTFFNPEQDIQTLALLCQASPNCALSD